MRIHHPLTLAALCVVLHESLGAAQHSNNVARLEHYRIAEIEHWEKRHLRSDSRGHRHHAHHGQVIDKENNNSQEQATTGNSVETNQVPSTEPTKDKTTPMKNALFKLFREKKLKTKNAGNGHAHDDDDDSDFSDDDVPTNAPTDAPTGAPTDAPTDAPTVAPTDAPTDAPTEAPTNAPTGTDAPTDAPTDAQVVPTFD
uniref:RxLR effector protein Htp1 n=1 Tax=Saprolegnia parasitica (strain CBS 223.65) TaxID=695850 RepID=HTP1_SAPPC|nr:RecName: Full=RxLR effector protein Htp1; AltName: Full=Host targeting protein 1; Flags: Precursor [Saprolegnia parasitica CBS 223.65]ADB84848.1 host targeting protein 1 [Saprolegnia parasitica]